MLEPIIYIEKQNDQLRDYVICIMYGSYNTDLVILQRIFVFYSPKKNVKSQISNNKAGSTYEPYCVLFSRNLQGLHIITMAGPSSPGVPRVP